MATINDTNFHIAITDWSNIGSASTYGDISGWDTSGVTDMSFAFNNMSNFNEDIHGWNVSNVTNMQGMFKGCSSFNHSLSSWNTQNVVDVSGMFQYATLFDGEINTWSLRNVKFTTNMFNNASSFNKDISSWYMPNLLNADSMFKNATLFNCGIGVMNSWYMINVTSTRSMFEGATAFSKDITGWNMTNVVDVSEMFKGATEFDISLSSWKLVSVTSNDDMFTGSKAQAPEEWGNFFQQNNNTASWQTTISNVETKTNIIDFIPDEPIKISAVSEGVPFMSGPRYGYISIDDHQTNSKSEFQVVYGDSVRDDNIIARINLAPRSIHTLSLRDAGMANLLNRTRTYQGPVNIQKLTIKLYDEYGRIIDLNNTDWSFTLEFEKEVKELVGNE